ncbi:hypothetical protein K439DRAFT_1611059 [Ramaria rubella]|nr:hypothetical protein K439DRAFT_1611059 [Ramaria rubella]
MDIDKYTIRTYKQHWEHSLRGPVRGLTSSYPGIQSGSSQIVKEHVVFNYVYVPESRSSRAPNTTRNTHLPSTKKFRASSNATETIALTASDLVVRWVPSSSRNEPRTVQLLQESAIVENKQKQRKNTYRRTAGSETNISERMSSMDDFAVACAAALVSAGIQLPALGNTEDDTYLSLFDPRVVSPRLEPIDKEGTMFRLTTRSESCNIETMSLDKPVSKLGTRPDSPRLSSKAHEMAAQRKQPLHSKSLYMQQNAHEEFIPHVADLSVKCQVGAEMNYVHRLHASVKVPSLWHVSFAKDLGLSQNLEAEAAHKNGQQRKNFSPRKQRKTRRNYSCSSYGSSEGSGEMEILLVSPCSQNKKGTVGRNGISKDRERNHVQYIHDWDETLSHSQSVSTLADDENSSEFSYVGKQERNSLSFSEVSSWMKSTGMSLEMSSSPVPTVLSSGADSVLCSSTQSESELSVVETQRENQEEYVPDEHKASSCASIASNLTINLRTPVKSVEDMSIMRHIPIDGMYSPESSHVSSCTRLSDETYTTSQSCMSTVAGKEVTKGPLVNLVELSNNQVNLLDNNGDLHHVKLLVDHTIMVNLSAFEVKAAWATGRLNAAAEAATTTAVLVKSIDRETKYVHTLCVTSQDSDKISESPGPSEKMVVPVAQYISIVEEMNKYLTKRNSLIWQSGSNLEGVQNISSAQVKVLVPLMEEQ